MRLRANTALCLLMFLLFAVEGHAQDGNGFCQVSPVRSDAIDWPSRHAWNLFVALNHPAIDKNIRRGIPDCTKRIGTPGTTSVWETWRNAHTEVFSPVEPPEWDDTTKMPDEKPGQVPSPGGATTMATTVMINPGLSPNQSFHRMKGPNGPTIFFSPGEDGVFDNKGGFGETRMNRTTYDFIKKECLWNRQGVLRYAEAIKSKAKGAIILPPDSIEVKAAWLDFDGEGIPADVRSTYYTATYKGKDYGLTALHILTKDIPNWFWASFHHVRSPSNPWEVPDTFGRPKALDGTVWANYVLGGTQIDFSDSKGKPTILSDHYVEFGFQKSSCITCHATASISLDSKPAGPGAPGGDAGAMPGGQPRSICLLDPNVPGMTSPAFCKAFAGAHLFKPGGDELNEERGAPLANWFNKNGQPFYFQTDFLWSIPFRSRRVEEQGAPPNRCKW